MISENMYLNNLSEIGLKPMRDGYGEAVMEMARREPRLLMLVADLIESLKLEQFKKEFPERLIEIGIAEQNMMGVAAGIAIEGSIPVVNSFACFSPGRNWEQLKVSVCLTKNNVKIVGGHSGFGNGVDGANQQMFEDLALTRVLPNMMVVVPADYWQAKKATRAMIEYQGPVYMRMTKPGRAMITSNMTPFELGKAQVLRGGKDVSIFACGEGVYQAMLAAEELKNEMEVEVVNVHTIKPIDKEAIVRSAKKTGKVITVEEHSINGGLGGAVAEVLVEEWPTKMIRIGMKDRFGESGEPEELMKKYGISMEAIVEAIRSI